MVKRRIPVNIVTGFLGAGKTTAILELLANRPGQEPWAVLVNEFGKVPIDEAALRGIGEEAIPIAEVAGGCLCCTAGVNMQVALTGLLNETSVTRILIEPTGLGHPDRIRDMLSGDPFRDVLVPAATLCLIDPRQFTNPRFVHLLTYWEQIKTADVVVINKTDLADERILHACHAKLRQDYPEKLHWVETEQGRLDPTWLDVHPGAGLDEHGPDEAHHTTPDHPDSGEEVVELLGGRARRLPSSGLGRYACGWIFDEDIQFSHERLARVLAFPNQGGGDAAGQDADRIKGILHTDRGWWLYNAVGSEATWKNVPPREDSRLEYIRATDALDWRQFEEQLLACTNDVAERTSP